MLKKILSFGVSFAMVLQSSVLVLGEEQDPEAGETEAAEIVEDIEADTQIVEEIVQPEADVSEEPIEETVEEESTEEIAEEENSEVFVVEENPDPVEEENAGETENEILSAENQKEEIPEDEILEEDEAEAEEEIVEEEELIEEESEEEVRTLSASAGNVVITVCGMLPENGSLRVEEVHVELEEFEVLGAYDITILKEDGKEFEPEEDTLHVAIELPELAEEDRASLQVHHLSDVSAENAEDVSNCDLSVDTLVDVDVHENSIEFETEGFSVYLLLKEIEKEKNIEISGTFYATVQEAIDAAVDGDVLLFNSDMEESVHCGKALTFDLNGHSWTGSEGATCSTQNAVTIRNGSMSAVMNERTVYAKAALIVENMNFTGTSVEGLDLSGGIILTKGDLRVVNSSFKDGNAGDGNGGAIYHTNGDCSLTILNSTFRNNKAKRNGGAIYTSANSVVLQGNEFSDNVSWDTAFGFYGGAVYTYESSGTIDVESCSFYRNSVAGYRGGAVFASGSISVSDSVFEDNCAKTNGGAVYASESAEIRDSVFRRNTAQAGSGGAVCHAPMSASLRSFTFEGNTYEGNTAYATSSSDGRGGAVYISGSKSTVQMRNETVQGNTASDGGGIYLYAKDVKIEDSVIRNNHAQQLGGGVFIMGVSAGSSICLDPDDAEIYGNTADGEYGRADELLIAANSPKCSTKDKVKGYLTGVVYNGKSLDAYVFNDDAWNRHVYINEQGRFVLNANKIQNETVYNGSYYYGYFRLGYGSVSTPLVAVYLDPSGKHTHDAKPEIQLLNETPQMQSIVCRTLEEAVQEAESNGKDSIYVCSTYTVTKKDEERVNQEGLTFVRCADNVDAVFETRGDIRFENVHVNGDHVPASSPLVRIGSGTLSICGATILENGRNENGYGGAVVANGSNLFMDGGIIRNNLAKHGAGIFVQYGTVTLEGGEISDNKASDYGGGVYAMSVRGEDTATVNIGVDGGSVLIKGNTAYMGGGVFLSFGTHYIYAGRFEDNEATRQGDYYDGGGLYVEKNTTCYMRNVYVSGNHTLSNGVPGAAVAACPSGQLAVYDINGAYVAKNGTPDIAVVAGGISYPHSAYVSDILLGGTDANFTKGRSAEKAPKSYYQFTNGYFSVTSNPSEQAEQLAEASATVFFTGNKCQQYGSAIMTNGTVIIGTETKALKVNKEWSDGAQAHINDKVEVQLQYKNADGNWCDVDKKTRSDAHQVLSAENNWSFVWSSLGGHAEWRVIETKGVPGYFVQVGKVEKSNGFKSIQADQYYIQTISNTKKEGSLTVNKTVEGRNDGSEYAFTIRLKIVSDNTYGIPYVLYHGDRTEDGILTVDEQEATFGFTLAHGDRIVLSGIPYDTEYEITEAPGNYTTYAGADKRSTVAGVITEREQNVEWNYRNVLPPPSVPPAPTPTPVPPTPPEPYTPETGGGTPYTPQTGRRRPYTPRTEDETGLLTWGIWMVVSLGAAVAVVKTIEHKKR